MFITPNPSTPPAQHPQAGTKMVCWVWGSVWGLGVDLSARRGCQGCASHPQLLGLPLALVGHHHRADKGHEHHGNESQIHLWRGRVSGQGAGGLYPPSPVFGKDTWGSTSISPGAGHPSLSAAGPPFLMP